MCKWKLYQRSSFSPAQQWGVTEQRRACFPKQWGKNKKTTNKTTLFFPPASSLSRTQQDTAGARGSSRFPQTNTVNQPVHAAEADGSEPYNKKPHNHNPYNRQLGLDALLLLTTAVWCSLGPALAGITGRFISLGQFSCC